MMSHSPDKTAKCFDASPCFKVNSEELKYVVTVMSTKTGKKWA